MVTKFHTIYEFVVEEFVLLPRKLPTTQPIKLCSFFNFRVEKAKTKVREVNAVLLLDRNLQKQTRPEAMSSFFASNLQEFLE